VKQEVASITTERDTLHRKLKQTSQQMRVVAEDITRKEADMVSAKEQLGKALNQAFEFENMYNELWQETQRK